MDEVVLGSLLCSSRLTCLLLGLGGGGGGRLDGCSSV